MRLPLGIRIGGPSWHRRRAAEMVLEEWAGADVERAVAEDPRLARELAGMRAIAGTLQGVPAEAWESHLGPAPELRPAARPQAGQEQSAARPFGRLPRARGMGVAFRPIGAVAAAACIAGAFFVGALTHPWTSSSGSGGPAVARVVLTPVTGTGTNGRAVAYMLGGGGRMRLRILHLPRSRPGTYYELWLMTSTSDLVGVSSFRVGNGGSGELNLILPADPTHYRYLDISVQRVGGGQAISPDSVLRGPIRA